MNYFITIALKMILHIHIYIVRMSNKITLIRQYNTQMNNFFPIPTLRKCIIYTLKKIFFLNIGCMLICCIMLFICIGLFSYMVFVICLNQLSCLCAVHTEIVYRLYNCVCIPLFICSQRSN